MPAPPLRPLPTVRSAEPGTTTALDGLQALGEAKKRAAEQRLAAERALREAEELEQQMLDFAFDVQPNSRLSCQIKVDDSLDGLVVRIPPRQY